MLSSSGLLEWDDEQRVSEIMAFNCLNQTYCSINKGIIYVVVTVNKFSLVSTVHGSKLLYKNC